MDKVLTQELPPLMEKIPTCGTIGCIAGWTCVAEALANKTKLKTAIKDVLRKVDFPIHHAADLLDLTPDEEDRFFYLDGWPRKLLKEYDADVKPKDRARVTCKRIDLFLKSGGRK